MVPPNHFQQLHNLDKGSPEFYKQLNDFLRGDEYRDALQDLQGEDLMWLVEYLGSVSLQIVSPKPVLSTGVGSHRYLRHYEYPTPGIRRAMRH